MTPLALALGPRRVPLPPVGFVAEGHVVADVVARLRVGHGGLAIVRGMRGVSGVRAAEPLLVVLAVDDDEHRLPWVDGVRYVGREPTAPTLLVPTTRALSVPVTWAAAAIARQIAGAVLVLEDRLVPVQQARALDDDVLAWLAAP